MKLSELLKIMDDEVGFALLTRDDEILFMGCKYEFYKAIEEAEEEEKAKLIKCLEKEVKSIKRP